ncbi:MAG: hypothetical protein KME45_29485 [Stenomitos rutilans HA7619-LM2]|jgi:hypothetical protein|nr:hypothetical protein [Stenomitos rutilans HA7619-LM2]
MAEEQFEVVRQAAIAYPMAHQHEWQNRRSLSPVNRDRAAFIRLVVKVCSASCL